MPLKPGPKRIADSTGKPDRRQRDNKNTPGNTPSLKPPVPKKKMIHQYHYLFTQMSLKKMNIFNDIYSLALFFLQHPYKE